MFTKSQRMAIFNKARAAASQGKLDDGRVRRAFGIIQSNGFAAKVHKYLTTTDNCTCEDHRRTGKACKHMIAVMMFRRLEQQQKGGGKA